MSFQPYTANAVCDETRQCPSRTLVLHRRLRQRLRLQLVHVKIYNKAKNLEFSTVRK